MLTVRAFSEFWIIDHSTTTAEAHGHTGGRSGRGGDLALPLGQSPGVSSRHRRKFSGSSLHTVHTGSRGVVRARDTSWYSTTASAVPESIFHRSTKSSFPLTPRVDTSASQRLAFGPDKPVWSFTAPEKTDYFAPLMSSAQRLPNGDTMICDGVSGTLFEVTSDLKVVWRQKSPSIVTSRSGELGPADSAAGTESRPHEILSALQRDALKMSSEQKKDLDDFQHELDAKLEKTLKDEQRKRLRETVGFGGFTVPGEIMSLSRQVLLKPTDEQKKTLVKLQDGVDAKLAKIFTAEQKIQFERMKQDFGRVGFSGSLSATKPAAPIASPASRCESGLPCDPLLGGLCRSGRQRTCGQSKKVAAQRSAKSAP